ncbi:formate hydrogenlyase subunit 4 [Candidatus Kuenenia stuttgartiensis]|uniref:Formate hydrogenlyase subunit 4 n=2 Tax=Kuenenia stuttgartiensis TaxID=174633 RepID=Q1PZL7_KUEST|nr:MULTISPECIES: NADH-quinone oxidoreductase subunit H [Kuenenia]MBE7546689.1 NADH-quinone oxidoreductase subunit H [Planctomycetia bacterium]MBW7940892.1 NADH-quinone oxidoreductase subunit H [Candidatus Kuenenia stuttgartiensis]MBZ0190310.1 NADH-quinone oxidoreductase subunit H [Candidatus Kuenenia stuttgartiensis]MCF6150940.1 formate hydrogenlyase [Candidatus Kuenenia stuttgartiensis]MCL4725913.1 NADH-quinone oxidoreductase subunit H [Candidatus Kuenenia stuttgartiensis]
MITNIILTTLQILVIAGLAPLVKGFINKMEAYWQCRRGPSMFQPYYNLIKLLQKDVVVSETASWIFSATPYVVFVSILVIALLIPVLSAQVPLDFTGDIILIVYLFALGRFFLALSSLDTGSAFGGMGGSREMTISSMAEPAMMLSIFTVSLTAGSTNLSSITGTLLNYKSLNPSLLLAFAALAIVIVAETGRIPVDNPFTHLELTMIHEGMILEFSGRYLALIEWASSMKLLLLLTILVNTFLPWGIATDLTFPGMIISFAWYLVKIGFFAFAIVILELSFSKLRLFRIPNLLGTSFVLSVLAIISFYVVS